MTTGQAQETVAQDSRVTRTQADVARTALRVLTGEGLDALTHARVAEIAGYSKTTLYTHWPTRLDLFTVALDALGELQHHVPTGDLRADLIGELTMFRQAVLDLRLDRVLFAMAQWATIDSMTQIRDSLNTDAQRPIRTILEKRFAGAELEAAISMLAGVVACPSLMFGTLPDDDVIAAAVGLVVNSAGRGSAQKNPA